jgi:O-antigen/teichoic acid export membrane protein
MSAVGTSPVPPTENAAHSEELREAAAHGIRWSAIARPTTEFIQLGSMVVLARLIVPAEFGRFAIALIAQQVAYLIVAGGLSAALVQRKTLDRAHVQTGMALALLLGLALAGLTLIGAWTVISPIFGGRTAMYVALMAPLCLVSALNAVPSSTLSRQMKFRRLSEIEMLNTLARVAVAIGFALVGLEGEALVIGLISGSVLAAAAAWVSAPPPMPRLDRRAARELMDYGLPTSLAAITWVGFSNVDYAIIGARLGALQTGFYFRAYTLAVEYQNKVSVVMTQVGFPVLSRASSAADLDHLRHEMVRLLTIVLFPLLVLLAITAPTVVPLLFGPGWGPAVTPVQILALGGASTLVINAVGTVLMATGRPRALLGFGVAHFAAYALTVILVVPLGIVAVAIDAAVVHTAFLLVSYRLMLRDSAVRALRTLWDDIAPATVSCLGLAGVALPASMVLTAAHVPSLVYLAVLAIVTAAPYLLTLRFCFPDTWRTQRAVMGRIVPARLRGLRIRGQSRVADSYSA